MEKLKGEDGLKTDLGMDYARIESEYESTKYAYTVLVKQVPTYLHPNMAERMKMGYMALRKQETKYNSNTQDLQEQFAKCCQQFDDSGGNMTNFGVCLEYTKDAFEEISAYRLQFEDLIMQDVVTTSKETLEGEMKAIAEAQKKLDSKRLQFDAKRYKNVQAREKGKDDPVSVTDMADSKAHLDTAKETAASQIGDFLRKQDLHVAKLDNFVEAHIEYFKQSLERLQKVQAKIREKQADPSSSSELDQALIGAVAPVDEDGSFHSGGGGAGGGGRQTSAPAAAAAPAARPRPGPPPGRKAKPEGRVVKALYDFVAENDGELNFNAADRITNVTEIDANWFEGTCNGKRGMFPTTYVE